MIDDVGGVPADGPPLVKWPCPACGGAYPDTEPGAPVCQCGSLWAWGAKPAGADWEMIRHLLACRSGGRTGHCERCGKELTRADGTVHHRNPRGMGGSRDPAVNDLCNLLLLCGGKLGGVVGCHGDTEHNRARAYATGWLVHTGHDPARVPVELPGGRRVRLARDVPEYLPPGDGLPYAV